METPLNRSIAMAYSVQRISRFSSTPVSRYTSLSIGLNKGSRNVFSLPNTRVMKTPSGLVTRKITSRKKPICNQPFAVMDLELLGFQQGIEQIPKQKRT